MIIPLFKPTLRRKDMDSVLTCMVSDRLAPGLYHEEFLSEIARRLDAAGGVALAGYYSAISLAFDILGLEKGDAIVISPLAPAVYMAVLEKKGLLPLIVDVDVHSGLMAQAELEKTLERSPKAILLHHTLGIVYNMELFSAYGIPVIEDISHALGGKWGDKPVGSTGAIVIASLSEENVITAGSGGLVLVRKRSDVQIVKRILEKSPEYVLLPDLNAAVAIAQLRELTSFIETRKEIARIDEEALMRSRHSTLVQPEGGVQVHYSFPVVVETSMKEVRQFAKKKGIDTHSAFSETMITMDDTIYNSFPNAKSLLLRCVLFPLYPMLGRANIGTIAKVLAVLP
jgi:dTDP-4-amino-4,6-dideoxygalactose transaminase